MMPLTSRFRYRARWLGAEPVCAVMIAFGVIACGSSGAEAPTGVDDGLPPGQQPTTIGTNPLDPNGGEPVGPADPTAPVETTAPSNGPVPPSPSGAKDPSTLPDGVAPTTQLARLTQDEYERALSDLLSLELQVKDRFPSEQPTLYGYFDRAALRVSDRLYDQLEPIAQEAAAQLVATPDAYAKVVGCTTTDSVCRDSFLNDFGLRAYRRPLSSTELARYQSLFDSAATLIGSGNAFADGVQLTLEAMLQSPNFLYRVERGEGSADEVGIPLSDYEVASRLSFTLLGSSPDAELLAQAAQGSLSTAEQIAAQAERLVALPEVRERVLDFHDRWLELEALVGASKDATLYPNFGPELTSAMHEETLRFIEDVTLTGGGAVSQLLMAQHSFVNADLATLYGLQGTFGNEFTRVELSSVNRGGLLTQGSFLAGHASSSKITSPILRGIFVLRRMLCQVVPPPPANATQEEPPPPETPVVTTREFYTWKTSMSQCIGCHSIINPVGFAFEEYDAIGQARTHEEGAPIDATGTVTLSGRTLTFNGAHDLTTQMAALPDLHECYAKNWLQYAYGRLDTDEDLRTIGVIAQNLGTEGYGVRELLVDLTRSAAFSHLAVSN